MHRAVRAALLLCFVFGSNLEGCLAFSTIYASKFASTFLRGGGSVQPAKFFLESQKSQPANFFQVAPFQHVQRRSSAGSTLVELTMNQALARPGSVKGGGGGDGKRVAIIGGGIAGLVCANRLQQLGFEPFVYDTGKKAVGGRVSSRVLSVPTTVNESAKESTKSGGGTKTKKQSMTQYKVDHSSQFFTADDVRFQRIVDDLEAQGLVREWTGPVGEITGKTFAPLPLKEEAGEQRKLYVGVGGMDAISKGLAKPLKCEIDCWVANVLKLENGQWRLFKDNAMRRALEPDVDYLVVAHNGKCAERLMRDAGVPALHRLLKCKFGSGAPPRGLMQLSSLWVLVFAVEGSLNLPFEGAFIKDHPDLSWVADNTKKLRNSVAAADGGGGVHETWTVISSREYGTRNKVPQEAVPREMDLQVLAELTAAFEQAAGLAPGSIKPVAHRTQVSFSPLCVEA